MVGIPVAAVALGLAACAPVQDAVLREGARAAVRPVLTARFPGMPLEPATDCIIDAATGPELRRLARGLAQPVADPDTAALVAGIAARPDTTRCLTTAGLAPFLR
jgi:hypothetical protein